METLRTFVAVEISEEVRQRAIALVEVLRASQADVRWVAPETMHLTLKFLGDVPAVETPAVCRAVAEGVAGCKPFALEMRGVGAFPNAHRPRTVWLGAGAGSDALVELHKAVDRTLRALGYPREDRRFEPHLTIGRVRDGRLGLDVLAGLIGDLSAEPVGAWQVGEVVVFSSLLRPEGPLYTPLSRAPLAG